MPSELRIFLSGETLGIFFLSSFSPGLLTFFYSQRVLLTLHCRNQHNVVEQLSSNGKYINLNFKKKREEGRILERAEVSHGGSSCWVGYRALGGCVLWVFYNWSRDTPRPLENMKALNPGQPQGWANRGHLQGTRVGVKRGKSP